MIGLNSGLLGVRRVPTTGSASGLWALNEQVLAQRANIWPLEPILDPDFASVSLLLHMDGANDSTTFTDSSSSARTVTAVGNAKISTAQSKFGGASGLFDGSGDYCTVTTSAFGTNDFTIEAWIRPSGFNDYNYIYDSKTSDADTTGFGWGFNSAGGLFVYADDNFRLQVGTVSTNTWTHVALSRSSGTWRHFVNGVVQGLTYSNSSNFTRTFTRIGSVWFDAYYINGYMDDLRITNGVARYTASFTPPAAAFPNA